jgi:hypothetical protein
MPLGSEHTPSWLREQGPLVVAPSGKSKPNLVFDDSPSSGIASAILLRRSVAEHACQRCLTTLRSQAPACAMERRPVVVEPHAMRNWTTDRCQAPPGTALSDSHAGAVPGGQPQDVGTHTRHQGFADRGPSSRLADGLLRPIVVEHDLGRGSMTERRPAPRSSRPCRPCVVQHGLCPAFPPSCRQAPWSRVSYSPGASSTLLRCL